MVELKAILDGAERTEIRELLEGLQSASKKNVNFQEIKVSMPSHLEMCFYKVWINSHDCLLLCVCYRPQWHGSEPIIFLKTNLDNILMQNSCQNVIIVGDLNHNIISRSFEDLLDTHGLINHVNFPTHISGSSLDPVLTDMSQGAVTCRNGGAVGTSDHYAVISTVSLSALREDPVERTLWKWEHSNWLEIKRAIADIEWDEVLSGDIDLQVDSFNKILSDLQCTYVPHNNHVTKPTDQPWFGPRCRHQSNLKKAAWRRLKRNPTVRNKVIHKNACDSMKATQKWAIRKWEENLKNKLIDGPEGGRKWWSGIKQQQGLITDDEIPPLEKEDGSYATTSSQKAQLLANFFSEKMKVCNPLKPANKPPRKTNVKLEAIEITQANVLKILKEIDPQKAMGPDKISPHMLSRCAQELAGPLTKLFQKCMHQKKWPKMWKKADVTAVYKKGDRTLASNYRPISLLSCVGKILEKIIASALTQHLTTQKLVSLKQFGYREGMSASDLMLGLTTDWQDALNKGDDIIVVALDIAGAFDKVWHSGLLAKLESYGITGSFLDVCRDYLGDRQLRVVINGYESSYQKIGASVPQGSVLGPILWNIFFNDLLNLVPQAYAYADDCTLSFRCTPLNKNEVIQRVNCTLKNISDWCKKWQVTLATEKTQAIYITKRRIPVNSHLNVDDKTVKFSKEINILGITIDSGLTFTSHLKAVATKAGRKLSIIRRISHILNSNSIKILYSSQVLPVMEYCPLSWNGCPSSYLQKLDSVRDRAQRLIDWKRRLEEAPIILQQLQHRRNVSAMCVFYKVHRMRKEHLQCLRIAEATPVHHNLRNSNSRNLELHIPRSRTDQHLRSFLPKYTRMWNNLVRRTSLVRIGSLQAFKSGVHRWLGS